MDAPDALARIVIVVGDDDRRVEVEGQSHRGSGSLAVRARPAEEWPFCHPLSAPWPEGPGLVVWAPNAHRALDVRQPPHTRLVTTQAHYLFAEWAALLANRPEARLVATMRRDVVRRQAPDILQRRGLFAQVHVHEVDEAAPGGPDSAGSAEWAPEDDAAGDAPASTQARELASALRKDEPAERLRACVQALARGRTAPALVATASVCQEVNDLESAARDLDEALVLAPDWAAAHFERGKAWLRLDDMEAAARSFRAAAERLPRFGGAWGNLGAALGELDRPAEALDAFERLLALDPASPQAHNNIGVVTRELGRLPESERAFRRVIELEPNLAFGYYNLGHTLFLQGRYQAAATAYGQGQSMDPDRNPVQATRLALCKLATGDPSGALAELKRASGALPREYRRQVLADTSAVLWALVTHKPDLDGWHGIHDWLTGELSRLA